MTHSRIYSKWRFHVAMFHKKGSKWWTQVSTLLDNHRQETLTGDVILGTVTIAFLVSLCASVSICSAHWVQILEYSSCPVIAIIVLILVDRADHNSSVIVWLLLHISLLTWWMWGTTSYYLQPISLITTHCFNCTSESAILVSDCGVAICWAKFLWWNMIENVWRYSLLSSFL